MDVAARTGVLEPHRHRLVEWLRQHRGNADVVRQDLAREISIRRAGMGLTNSAITLTGTTVQNVNGTAIDLDGFFVGGTLRVTGGEMKNIQGSALRRNPAATPSSATARRGPVCA